MQLVLHSRSTAKTHGMRTIAHCKSLHSYVESKLRLVAKEYSCMAEQYDRPQVTWRRRSGL
eukprot:3247660-Amphidinium_carterae.1